MLDVAILTSSLVAFNLCERPHQADVMEHREWFKRRLPIEARAAVEHFTQELGLEPRRDPEAINPPFRTPLGMWFMERIAVESLANEILYGRLAQRHTDAESLDITLDLQEI